MDTGQHKQVRKDVAHAAGRVVIDSRGRNVWQWNDDQLDSTTIMLARLDNSALALEPTRKVRRPDISGAASQDAARPAAAKRARSRPGRGDALDIEQTFSIKPDGGFDPYNSS